MPTIPIYLKLKGGSSTTPPLLLATSATSIDFNNKTYDFSRIFLPTESSFHDLLDFKSQSSCTVFMGPTGSGKTTTLHQVVDTQIKSLQGSHAYLTAFEVSENKHLIDLLETVPERKEILSLNFESNLHRVSLETSTSSHLIKKVFSNRSTSKTSYNSESSRSCLIITFFFNNKRCTYIDLMGNEKFNLPKDPVQKTQSNIFANLNMSSITQLLTKKSFNGRSSNLITNLIFKNDSTVSSRNINIVMNLDPHGDVSLIKSALGNIADLTKTFKLGSPMTSPVKSVSSNIPSYARPTLASLSPRKVSSPRSPIRKPDSPFKRKLNTPCKMKIAPILSKPRTSQKSLSCQSPTRSLACLDSSPVSLPKHVKVPANTLAPAAKLQPSTEAKLMNDYNKIQISNLKKHLQDMELENQQLKTDNQDLMNQIQYNVTTSINSELTIVEDVQTPPLEMLSLKSELDSLREINSNNKLLIERQRQILNDSLNDLKGEFTDFKQKYGSFRNKVENIKDMNSLLQQEIVLLKDMNSIQEGELSTVNNKLELTDINRASLHTECTKNLAQIDDLNATVAILQKSNKKLFDQLSEKEDTLLETSRESFEKMTKTNEEIIKKNSQIDSLTTQVNVLTAEIATRDSTISGKDAELVSLAASKEELVAKLSSEIAKISNKDDELKQKEAIISDLRNETNSSMSDEKDTQITTLSNEISRLKDDLSTQENLHISENTSKEESIKELQQMVSQKDVVIQSHIEQLNAMDIQISAWKKEKADLVTQLEAGESFRTTLQLQLQEQSSIKADLESQVTRFQGDLQQAKSESESKSQVSHFNAELEKQVDSLITDNKHLQSEVDDLQKFNAFELREKQTQIDSLNEQLDLKEQVIADLGKQLDLRLEDISKLQQQLKDVEINYSDMNSMITANSASVIELQTVKAGLETQIADLKDQLVVSNNQWNAKYDSMVQEKDLEMDAVVEVKNQEIVSKEQEIMSKVQQIEAKEQVIRALEASKSSEEPEIHAQSMEPVKFNNLPSISFNKPFDGANIFEDSKDDSDIESNDIESGNSSRSTTPIEEKNHKEEKKQKRALMPSKADNYKTLVNSMSKVKKMKKKTPKKIRQKLTN